MNLCLRKTCDWFNFVVGLPEGFDRKIVTVLAEEFDRKMAFLAGGMCFRSVSRSHSRVVGGRIAHQARVFRDVRQNRMSFDRHRCPVGSLLALRGHFSERKGITSLLASPTRDCESFWKMRVESAYRFGGTTTRSRHGRAVI
jgi:hypothetical protein